jgi:hypothetical protein
VDEVGRYLGLSGVGGHAEPQGHLGHDPGSMHQIGDRIAATRNLLRHQLDVHPGSTVRLAAGVVDYSNWSREVDPSLLTGT